MFYCMQLNVLFHKVANVFLFAQVLEQVNQSFTILNFVDTIPDGADGLLDFANTIVAVSIAQFKTFVDCFVLLAFSFVE